MLAGCHRGGWRSQIWPGCRRATVPLRRPRWLGCRGLPESADRHRAKPRCGGQRLAAPAGPSLTARPGRGRTMTQASDLTSGSSVTERARGVQMPDSPLPAWRVLDMSQAISGPYAARILSDLGADVLRLE